MMNLLKLSLFFFLISCSNDPEGKPIEFPENPETYSPIGSIQFSTDYFQEEKKLVVASKSIFPFSLPFMNLVEEEYSDLPVIIFISHPDKENVIKSLNEYEFNYPFIYDPEGEFFKGNDLNQLFGAEEQHNLVAFFMKGEEIVEQANIGMPEKFREQLKKFYAE
jgi:hypothetical protein